MGCTGGRGGVGGGVWGRHRLWSAESEFYKKLQVVALEPGKAVIIRRDLAINLYGLSPVSRK